MIRQRLLRLARDTAATTALEFGIIGNVLVLLLFAGIEIGGMIWTQATLQVVAAETARCAALGTCTSPASFAVSKATAELGFAMITTSNVYVASSPTSSHPCGSVTSGAYEVVTITSSYWLGNLVYPIAAKTQTATACFPN